MELGNWYQSVVGIAAASIFVGGGVRQWLSDIEGPNRIPLVVYVLLSCLGLTFVAHSWMGAFPDRTVWQLLVDACTAAVGSVGTVGIVSNIRKPLASTGPVSAPSLRKLSVVFAISGLALAGSSACATRNGVQVSPEGTLALRANQLVQALRTVVTPAGSSPVEQLVASKTITVNEALVVANVVREVMVYAQDLATVLKVVDEAQTEAERSAGLQRAAVLVENIRSGLASATLNVGTETGRKAVLNVLTIASRILQTVGSLFPTPTPTPVPGF